MIKNTIETILILLIGLAIVLLVTFVPYALGHNAGYRDGQIDALNGEIYYKLERQEDNSFLWVECQGVCEPGKEAPIRFPVK